MRIPTNILLLLNSRLTYGDEYEVHKAYSDFRVPMTYEYIFKDGERFKHGECILHGEGIMHKLLIMQYIQDSMRESPNHTLHRTAIALRAAVPLLRSAAGELFR